MATAERRTLYYESDEEFDPSLSVDVNEYLIENWPTLTLKQRTSVWSLCQNDEDFDYESIHEQIDDWVYQLAEDNPEVNLGEDDYTDEDSDEEDQDEDEDDESLDGYLIVDPISHFADKYPNLTEQHMFDVSDHMNSEESFSWDALYTFMDAYIKQYAAEVDSTLNLQEHATEADNSLDSQEGDKKSE